MKLLIVPRWAGTATSDFYPWLIGRLQERHAALFSSIRFTVLPSPPSIKESIEAIQAELKEDPTNTVVMGHSVGFQAAMRAVAEQPVPIAGLFGVAGWWSVDKPWPSIMPWIEIPFLYPQVVQFAPKRFVLLSTDDPFTANYQETKKLFEERLCAQVEVINEGKHFNQSEEPSVLEALIGFVKVIESERSK
jgi:predicted alpha/beta hydrolase family esterase